MRGLKNPHRRARRSPERGEGAMNSAMTRRGVLTGLGAIPLVGGTRLDAARSGAALDVSSKAGFLNACMKMRGALDGRLIAGFCAGTYYGIVDAVATPLFDLLAGAFYVHRARNDGGYDRRYFEVAYFTDPATGVPLDTFANPYTGKTVAVTPFKLGPVPYIVTPDAQIVNLSGGRGPGNDDRYLPANRVGDDIWIAERVRIEAPASPRSKRFVYNEFTVAHAPVYEVADSARAFVRANTTTTIVVTWRPWLEMGDLPGHMLLSGGTGRMTDRLDDLPPRYVELGHRLFPEEFADPGAYLRRGWS